MAGGSSRMEYEVAFVALALEKRATSAFWEDNKYSYFQDFSFRHSIV